METIERIERIEYKTIEVISELKNTFDNKKYKVIGDKAITHLNKINELDLFDLGIRMQKRLKRFNRRFMLKKSLFSANKLLWLLSKHVLKLDYVIKISEPKHEAIQAKRKAWKEWQKEAEIALLEYKKEKGDYYKVI